MTSVNRIVTHKGMCVNGYGGIGILVYLIRRLHRFHGRVWWKVNCSVVCRFLICQNHGLHGLRRLHGEEGLVESKLFCGMMISWDVRITDYTDCTEKRVTHRRMD